MLEIKTKNVGTLEVSNKNSDQDLKRSDADKNSKMTFKPSQPNLESKKQINSNFNSHARLVVQEMIQNHQDIGMATSFKSIPEYVYTDTHVKQIKSPKTISNLPLMTLARPEGFRGSSNIQLKRIKEQNMLKKAVRFILPDNRKTLEEIFKNAVINTVFQVKSVELWNRNPNKWQNMSKIQEQSDESRAKISHSSLTGKTEDTFVEHALETYPQTIGMETFFKNNRNTMSLIEQIETLNVIQNHPSSYKGRSIPHMTQGAATREARSPESLPGH